MSKNSNITNLVPYCREGWIYQLPANIRGTILYITPSIDDVAKTLLALGCDKLIVLLLNKELCKAFNNPKDCRDLKIHLLESYRIYEEGSESYDGIIINNLSGIIAEDLLKREITQRQLFSTAFDKLKEDGFLYYSFVNKIGLKRLLDKIKYLRNKKRITKISASIPGKVIDSLNRTGFDKYVLKPYIIHKTTIEEVIPDRGYTTAKNSNLLSESIKEILLNRVFKSISAEAYGVIAYKNNKKNSLIDGLFDQLVNKKILEEIDPENIEIFHYYLLAGKAIISIGNRDEKEGKYIIIITLDELAITGRKKEKKIIDKIIRKNSVIAKYVPRVIDEGEYLNIPYFLIEQKKGITFDRDFKRINEATNNAVNLLININKQEKREILMNNDNYNIYFGNIIDLSINRYPEFEQYFNEINKKLKNIVIGKNILIVLMHGDYKLENIVFNKNTLEINGVIDWELADEKGFPLLDLLYLLTYNRMIKYDIDYFDVVNDYLEKNSMTNQEKLYIEKYRELYILDEEIYHVLLVMFIMHHISKRFYVTINDNLRRRQILKTIDNMIELLS